MNDTVSFMSADYVARQVGYDMTGEQAAHVVEILAATTTSICEGGPVPVRSRFTPPAPGGYA